MQYVKSGDELKVLFYPAAYVEEFSRHNFRMSMQRKDPVFTDLGQYIGFRRLLERWGLEKPMRIADRSYNVYLNRNMGIYKPFVDIFV